MGQAHTPPARKGQGKKHNRSHSARVQSALQREREYRAALDARMAAEAAAAPAVEPVRPRPDLYERFAVPAPNVRPRPGHSERMPSRKAVRSPLVKPAKPLVAPDDPWRQGSFFSLSNAFKLLEEGYRLPQVIRKTGWGEAYFDQDVDADGYLIP